MSIRPSACRGRRRSATASARTGSSKTVSGSAECSNEWFGSDPAVGVVKVCQGAGGSAVETGWTRIAGEGESFAVNGTQTVRYGSGAAWVTKTVAGGGSVHQRRVRARPAGRCRQAMRGVVGECGGAVAVSVAIAHAGACTRAGADGRCLQPAGRGARHVIGFTERRRRHAGQLHRGRVARRSREPRRRHVQLRRRSGHDSRDVADQGADRSQHRDRRRWQGHVGRRRSDPDPEPDAARLPDQFERPDSAAHRARQRPGRRQRLRGAGPERAAVRLGLWRRRRRRDRGARRAAARDRRRVPQQRGGVARARYRRRRDLRDRLARCHRGRLALRRQHRVERRRRRPAAVERTLRQQRVPGQQCDRRRHELGRSRAAPASVTRARAVPAATAARSRSTAATTPICWSAVRASSRTPRASSPARWAARPNVTPAPHDDRPQRVRWQPRAPGRRAVHLELGAARDRRIDLQQQRRGRIRGRADRARQSRDRQQHLRRQRGDAGRRRRALPRETWTAPARSATRPSRTTARWPAAAISPRRCSVN